MSCNYFLEVFGSGSGIIRKVSPDTRLVSGFLFFCSVLILPFNKFFGVLLIFLISAVCFILYRPSYEIVKKTIIFGFVMFAPLFLLIPFITDASGKLFEFNRFFNMSAYVNVLSLFIKGLVTILIFISIFSVLQMSDMVDAMALLGLPDFIIMLIAQIIQQTGLLYSETLEMAQAITLRGSKRGTRTLLLFSRYAPIVWLSRIYYKANRVSNAMAIRNYNRVTILKKDYKKGVTDLVFILTSFFVFAISLVVRIYPIL